MAGDGTAAGVVQNALIDALRIYETTWGVPPRRILVRPAVFDCLVLSLPFQERKGTKKVIFGGVPVTPDEGLTAAFQLEGGEHNRRLKTPSVIGYLGFSVLF